MVNRHMVKDMEKITEKVKKGDQHRHRRMFRVPNSIHEGYRLLSEQTGMPMSHEVRVALIEGLRRHGLWHDASPNGKM